MSENSQRERAASAINLSVLDDDACHRAMLSRDRRFEGVFVIGVITTGIYCRPGCPARMPKRCNVRFFPTTSAAREAGLRPCLRCRPDASPGTPASVGTPVTVTRALRLISEGALDEGDVESLADRLGLGDRQLRRLFDQHLGASPIAVAQTQRVHFARKLIEETELPMTEIALASGFGSVRRFNDVVRSSFARTPSALREVGHAKVHYPLRGAKLEIGSGAMTLRLVHRLPLDWDGLLAFLAARAIPGVEHVADGVYARTVQLGNKTRPTTFSVRRGDERHLLLTIARAEPRELFAIVGRVRRVFDLDADPVTIVEHLSNDEALSTILASRPGLRVPGAWCGFEIAVRAILGQQVTVRGATTLARRLVEAFGRTIEPALSPSLSRLFPDPKALAEADVASIGMPRARAEAIRALARLVRDGKLVLDGARPDETRAKLLAIPGVGAWTAEYVGMRVLKDPDAFPSGDVVLRRALSPRQPLTSLALERRAERFRPFRAYAAIALWSSAPSVARPLETTGALSCIA